MDNTIQELRKELFETLKSLRSNDIPLDKAQVIVQVAQAIINSAKVEVDFIKAVNATAGSGFIQLQDKVHIAAIGIHINYIHYA